MRLPDGTFMGEAERVPEALWPRRGWFLVTHPAGWMAHPEAHYFAPDASPSTGVYSIGERMSHRRRLRPWVLSWDIGFYHLCRRCKAALRAQVWASQICTSPPSPPPAHPKKSPKKKGTP